MSSLLVVCRALPYPTDAGDKVVTYGFLRCLAERGHAVHLLSFAAGDDGRSHLESICDSVTTVPPPPRLLPTSARRAVRLAAGRSHVMSMFRSDELARALADRIRTLEPATVLAEHPYIGQHFREKAVDRALAATGARPVTNAHVVEYAAHRRRREYVDDLRTRFALRLEVPRLRERERAVYERSQLTLVLGEADRRELAGEGVGPVARQRVAIAPDEYDPTPVDVDRPTVAFFGSYDWFPNRDAVRVLRERVWPAVRERRRDAELLLAGRAPTAEVRALGAEPGVSVRGLVDDLAGLVRSASVVVAPLRVGGGVRIKILESMAWGTPVVATPAATEGVEATQGTDLLVADDWDAFAGCVVRLLASPERQREIGESARRTVEDTYATDAVGDQLADNLGL